MMLSAEEINDSFLILSYATILRMAGINFNWLLILLKLHSLALQQFADKKKVGRYGYHGCGEEKPTIAGKG
jgi:hypothetical protein